VFSGHFNHALQYITIMKYSSTVID
jgi:hypothetical protein